MFKIDLDGKITITRGDDSGFITLFINKGTNLSPLRYVLNDLINRIITLEELEG